MKLTRETLETKQPSRYRLDQMKMPSESWRPSEAASMRRSHRTIEREIEKIPAWIRSGKIPDWQVKLRWPMEVHRDLVRETEFTIPCVIENHQPGEKGQKLGLRRLDLESTSQLNEITSVLPDGYLADSIRPVAAKVFNPFLYKEWAEANLIGIELSALCAHSGYRGGNLVQGLFELTVRTLLLSDRTWFLTFATEKICPLYQRVGFKKQGLPFV